METRDAAAESPGVLIDRAGSTAFLPKGSIAGTHRKVITSRALMDEFGRHASARRALMDEFGQSVQDLKGFMERIDQNVRAWRRGLEMFRPERVPFEDRS
jgi:hypothetical protein